jgi:hypothetical protein
MRFDYRGQQMRRFRMSFVAVLLFQFHTPSYALPFWLKLITDAQGFCYTMDNLIGRGHYKYLNESLEKNPDKIYGCSEEVRAYWSRMHPDISASPIIVSERYPAPISEVVAPSAPSSEVLQSDSVVDKSLADAKRKCADLGFVRGTPKFGQCVLKVSE